jgi:hypothetical protein
METQRSRTFPLAAGTWLGRMRVTAPEQAGYASVRAVCCCCACYARCSGRPRDHLRFARSSVFWEVDRLLQAAQLLRHEQIISLQLSDYNAWGDRLPVSVGPDCRCTEVACLNE